MNKEIWVLPTMAQDTESEWLKYHVGYMKPGTKFELGRTWDFNNHGAVKIDHHNPNTNLKHTATIKNGKVIACALVTKKWFGKEEEHTQLPNKQCNYLLNVYKKFITQIELTEEDYVELNKTPDTVDIK